MLTYGLQIGWISSMTNALQSANSPAGRPLTDEEMTWIASTLPIAGVLGVILYVYLADTYGRRVGVLAMAVPQAVIVDFIIKLSKILFRLK